MSMSLREIEKLEQKVRKMEEQNRPKARKIVTRDKQGRPVIEYQCSGPSSAFEKTSAELARSSNFVPALPLPQQNGTELALASAGGSTSAASASAAEGDASSAVAPAESTDDEARELVALVGISFHEARGAGVSPARLPLSPCGSEPGRGAHNIAGGERAQECDLDDNPLSDLIRRAQAQSLACTRRGRRESLDERGKGQLLGLLAVGLSLRQAAAVLGVSHTTLRRTLAAHAELADEINAARSRAALEPLACVIRESKRSWRAATWLLKYLDTRLKSRDETSDEWDRRMEEEHEGFKKRNGIR